MGKPSPGEGHWSRRRFLRHMLAASAGLLAGCAPALTRALTPLPTLTALRPSATARAAATLRPTLAPNEPLAAATTTATATTTPAPGDRLRNIVVFIQENHTFDSLFASFPGADGLPAGQHCAEALPQDPPHQHADAFQPQAARTAAARCSYTEADAPNYWKLARAFTLCDRYFSEVRGPSHPNYLMLTTAQSPIINTPYPHDECPDFCLDLPALPDRLDLRGLSWRDYGGLLTDLKRFAKRPEVFDSQDGQFFEDAAAGQLPNVAWLNSGFLGDGNAQSGHPPAGLCGAENYAVRVLNAVMAGPQWASTAVFLIWDDWGGFYDHVDPPVAERWRDGTPFRYGFRVPCLVISPYARPGYVAHTLYSHVSILRCIETVFGLEPLTARDAAAADMLDCFDFTQPPRAPLSLTPRACAA